MITHLSVRNYALIDHLSIDFQSGLSVITGETGSGKSIILGALGLALGERADHSSLSSSGEKCIVEVSFSITEKFKPFFSDNDLDFEATSLIRREIASSGKSRSFVNDTPVNLLVLKQLGMQLVDVHSQQENALLRDENFRFEFLDAMAENLTVKENYKRAYASWLSVKKELSELEESQLKASQDADYHAFQLRELDALNLDQLDQGEAELEASTLDNAESILTSLSEFKGLMEGDVGSIDGIQSALSRLQSIPNNARAEELAERLKSTLIELQDLCQEVENWSDEVEVNPSKLHEIQNQLDSLYRAQQKHGVKGVQELIEVRDELTQTSMNQDLATEHIEALRSQVNSEQDFALKVGHDLSKSRHDIDVAVQKSLTDLFAQLDLPHAHIEFCLRTSDELGIFGLDKIDINFSANSGSPLRAIENVASGGEISRVILAIKACFSGAMELPTLILDEIDTGVSGETAKKVAKVMASIGSNSQVIAISHLAQIAGQAQHHFKVSKELEEGQTKTTIRRLEDDERVEEIAEMMTGKSLTDAARESARTLLATHS